MEVVGEKHLLLYCSRRTGVDILQLQTPVDPVEWKEEGGSTEQTVALELTLQLSSIITESANYLSTPQWTVMATNCCASVASFKFKSVLSYYLGGVLSSSVFSDFFVKTLE